MQSSLVPDAPEEEGTLEETAPEAGDPGPLEEALDDGRWTKVADDGSDLRDDRARAATEPPFTPEDEDADLLG